MPSQKKHCVSAAVVVLRVYAMTCHCSCPTIIPLCLRSSGLKFLAFHQAWPASLGPQTISRMPKAWVEAPLLPVESTCMGSLNAANWFLKLLKDFSNLFRDTTQLLVSMIINLNESHPSMTLVTLIWLRQVQIYHEHARFFPQTLSFTCYFSLTFQVSAHLQCLIQCLHCPSKELCVDVLAWWISGWIPRWLQLMASQNDGIVDYWPCRNLLKWGSQSIENGMFDFAPWVISHFVQEEPYK